MEKPSVKNDITAGGDILTGECDMRTAGRNILYSEKIEQKRLHRDKHRSRRDKGIPNNIKIYDRKLKIFDRLGNKLRKLELDKHRAPKRITEPKKG